MEGRVPITTVVTLDDLIWPNFPGLKPGKKWGRDLKLWFFLILMILLTLLKKIKRMGSVRMTARLSV